MSKVCELWSLEELCEMDDEDMETLLEFYKPGKVPTFKEIRIGDKIAHDTFDGSFGWW